MSACTRSVPTIVCAGSGKKKASTHRRSEPLPMLVVLTSRPVTKPRAAVHARRGRRRRADTARELEADEGGQAGDDQHPAQPALEGVLAHPRGQAVEHEDAEGGAGQRSGQEPAHRRPVHLAAQGVGAAAEELGHARDQHVGADGQGGRARAG